MEKKKTILRLVLTASFVISSLVLISCKDDDSPSYSTVRTDTYTIAPPFSYASLLVSRSNGNSTLDNIWPSNGYSFYVFVSQDGEFRELGKIHSKETEIKNADRKKALHVKVPIPQEINVNKSYKVFFVDEEAKVSLSNNRILCNANLYRKSNAYIPGWYMAYGATTGTAQSFYLTTGEGLCIKNNSDKTITVKHKGFDTTQKWYYTNGVVRIDPDGNVTAQGSSESGDAESDSQKIKAGDYAWILSSYVPNGNYMTDAQLMLDINGVIVKTSQTSSQVTIEPGLQYRMYVKWDGEKLEYY